MPILYCFSPFIPPKLSRATISKKHSSPDISGLGSLQSWSHQVHTPRQMPPASATQHSSSREVKTFLHHLQKSRFSFWQWRLQLQKKHWVTMFTGGKPVRDHYPGCCTSDSCWFVGVSRTQRGTANNSNCIRGVGAVVGLTVEIDEYYY